MAIPTAVEDSIDNCGSDVLRTTDVDNEYVIDHAQSKGDFNSDCEPALIEKLISSVVYTTNENMLGDAYANDEDNDLSHLMDFSKMMTALDEMCVEYGEMVVAEPNKTDAYDHERNTSEVSNISRFVGNHRSKCRRDPDKM